MRKYLLASALLTITTTATAQEHTALSVRDYERAERMLDYKTDPLVDNTWSRMNWLPDKRVWYRVVSAKGSEFILVNPAKGSRSAAFDQQKLAAAFSTASGKEYGAYALPFTTFNYTVDGKAILFTGAGQRWKCDLNNYACVVDNSTAALPNSTIKLNGRNGTKEIPEVISPNGKYAALLKSDNLWVREIATGEEIQLTTDGIKDFGYATDNAGWSHSNKLVLSWSPDSKKIATFKQDQRHVKDMYLVTTNVGSPTLQAWKYPLPGDSAVAMIHRVIIDVEARKVINIQVPPDPHRATLSDDISSTGSFDDVDWSNDNSQLAFVSTSRDHKQEKLRIADATTGAVREVLEETVATQYESGQGNINWHYLKGSNEIIWYSERDNWGHLSLYNATTGKLKDRKSTRLNSSH